jgi:DNA-binding beta-propeller fold protein YncE
MKLMIKVFIIMASLVGLLFYFLKDVGPENNITSSDRSAAGLQKLASLPSSISESSGIEVLTQNGHYVTHNDAGNSALIYQIDAKGKVIKAHKLNVPNRDWEDLARDDQGNLYIADTGNNDNRRKELAIYKVGMNDLSKAEAIRFTYEDQKEFPPSKKDRNFDSEGLFWHKNKLYVVTKDRGSQETANIYVLPDEAGTYKAKRVGSAKLKGQVTGAAISPDGKLVAILEVEKLHLFRDFSDVAKFYEGETDKINLKGSGQTEGIAFENNNTLIITSEGGNLYRYKL